MPTSFPPILKTDRLLRPEIGRQQEPQAELKHVPVLLRHRKRPQWGLAIRTWSRDGRQALQFQDGKLRVFPIDSDSLIERVVRPVGETISLSRRLRAMSGVAQVTRRSAGDATPEMSFNDQLRLFRSEYPEGFVGDAWKHDRHGTGERNRLKRHRDPAIAEAGKLLTCEQLDKVLKSGDPHAYLQQLIALIGETNLVPQGQLARLEAIDEEGAEELADALRAMLYGHLGVADRTEQLVDVLTRATGKTPSWCLTTTLPALTDPQRFAYIRRTTIVEQAKALAPGLRVATSADGQQYEVMLSMMASARDRLTAAELNPRDMLDVYDFMYITLAPSAKQRLAALKD